MVIDVCVCDVCNDTQRHVLPLLLLLLLLLLYCSQEMTQVVRTQQEFLPTTTRIFFEQLSSPCSMLPPTQAVTLLPAGPFSTCVNLRHFTYTCRRGAL